MDTILSKIAFIIPVHNRREMTLQCLRSLSKIDSTALDLRIFVVDDGSSDGTSHSIRESFPDVVLISGNGMLHYAGGTNRGIEEALKWDPAYLVLMNDDTLFHEQFLQRLVATAKRESHSVVGALLLLWDQPHRVFQVGQVWSTWKGGWQMPSDLTVFDFPKKPVDVECIVGNCVLLPVAAVRECGLMDEKRFPHGWGDAQYLMKIRMAGWRLLVEPTAYVWCEPNTYPNSLHTLGVGEILKILFVDDTHPQNLKRQLIARWESAPKKSLALPAFSIYCVLLVKKTIGYGIKHTFPRSNQSPNINDVSR